MKMLFIGADRSREANVFERFISGSCAGALAQSFIYPLEVVFKQSFNDLMKINRLKFYVQVIENKNGFKKNR